LKAICDSSVLIGLAKIAKLELLKEIFDVLYVPEAVFNEVVTKGKGKSGVKEVSEAKWIYKRPVKDRRTVEMLTAEMGLGEAEVLVLGKELKADWLIIDDERARTAAIAAGFQVIGLAGILLLAKQRKLTPSVKPLLDELQDKNFRLSKLIYNEVLKKARE